MAHCLAAVMHCVMHSDCCQTKYALAQHASIATPPWPSVDIYYVSISRDRTVLLHFNRHSRLRIAYWYCRFAPNSNDSFPRPSWRVSNSLTCNLLNHWVNLLNWSDSAFFRSECPLLHFRSDSKLRFTYQNNRFIHFRHTNNREAYSIKNYYPCDHTCKDTLINQKRLEKRKKKMKWGFTKSTIDYTVETIAPQHPS